MYVLLAFERLPFLRNNFPFTKIVTSGNSPRFSGVVAVVVAADVATATVAAADDDVTTGAFLQFGFYFFPMMITIHTVG